MLASSGGTDIPESVKLEDYSSFSRETPIQRKRAAIKSGVRVRQSKKSASADRLLEQLNAYLSSVASALRGPTQEALDILMSEFGVLPYIFLDTLSDRLSSKFTARKFASFPPVYRKIWVKKALEDCSSELENEEYDGRSYNELMEAVEWHGDGFLVLRN
ncbi:hypothetical protein GQ44DRAFT_370010 [Phaeosphaeriaceae sp. PMI808]|nr:hypothetical protein GQ44DRAFT_370010 [Phaeosphaeriaceae sp. PMI808]